MNTSTSEPHQIGERTFTEEDQKLFAAASGDCNPMHLDPIAARRLLTGHQVVHGMHILIAALEYWLSANANRPAPLAISCSFGNPVNIAESTVFAERRRGDHEWIIDATVSGLLCSRTIITATPRKPLLGAAECGSQQDSDAVMIDNRLCAPLDELPEYHFDKLYVVRPGSADLLEQFPCAYRYLGRKRVAAVLALSYFVGMVCPGLHSIFSHADIDLLEDPAHGEDVIFWVEKYDERFRLFNISFRGCIGGSLRAFLRPPPQEQLPVTDLAKGVRPGEFAGTRSLILGGSRGLGEVTAKLIAAGGGEVIITYASGAEDARRVSDEINRSGLGRCEVVKLDLLTESFDGTNVSVESLDAVYFFATPRIQRKKAALFSPPVFREFIEFYIEKFHEMCMWLENRAGTNKLTVYFPSSVFVSERPQGMTEYAMAKAAAEVLVQDLAEHARKLAVVTTRLPRLSTDQTSSLLRLPTESNVDTLLPIIRSVTRPRAA